MFVLSCAYTEIKALATTKSDDVPGAQKCHFGPHVTPRPDYGNKDGLRKVDICLQTDATEDPRRFLFLLGTNPLN
jgi:hypothetical protein